MISVYFQKKGPALPNWAHPEGVYSEFLPPQGFFEIMPTLGLPCFVVAEVLPENG